MADASAGQPPHSLEADAPLLPSAGASSSSAAYGRSKGGHTSIGMDSVGGAHSVTLQPMSPLDSPSEPIADPVGQEEIRPFTPHATIWSSALNLANTIIGRICLLLLSRRG